jgi:hopanoid biosynthesis associated RND transporter like protein HpnN
MLESILVRTVRACTARPWVVIPVWLLLAALAALYTAQNFAISTDINKLISPDLPWRQRELAFDKDFPGQNEFILIVLDAPTKERASEATAALEAELRKQPKLFPSVEEQGGGDFFARNGLLFMPTAELEKTAGELEQAGPLIGTLTDNPNLVGLTDALSFGLAGVQRGQISLDSMTRPLTASATTIEDVLAGKRANFSWYALMSGEPPQSRDLRRLIQVQPTLDYAALEPGKVASDAIRKAAADLHLAEKFGARVRLTGPTPISDEEFATVQEGALVNGIGTVVVVLIILWLALSSARLIFAVFVNLFIGLALTGALGLMMVGALNMISVAFAVLFIGLGVDFGIQFAVRYRAERHDFDDLKEALLRATRHVGPPLTLAAAAVAAGFFSFLPTASRGVSELGQIAGAGMIIAFITSITLLPALLMVLNPPGEKEPVGFSALAPVDRFLERRRVPVLAGTALVVLLGLPLLLHLSFDFNPLHLRSAKVESIATYLDLQRDPQVGGSPIDIVAPSEGAIGAIVKRLAAVPEVSHTVTVLNFVPDDQDRKLAIIAKLKQTIGPDLEGANDPPPDDAATVAALHRSADALNKAAAGKSGSGADAAKRLSADLVKLADAPPAMRAGVDDAMVSPLKTALDDLRNLLKAERITLQNLPPHLLRDWVAPDGRTRVQVFPKNASGDNDAVRAFARAVLTAEPAAIGGPVSILESGNTIIRAFIEAGLWAILAIAILLWIVLGRFGDVLLTLLPLLLAGVVALEVTVLIGMPLNFANIIAMPLMLGLGVAFKIYYIMAWRSGRTNLLQSSLTRAVIWSALTTATAFGSLWLSSHPGTSSMGKLLALSLVCTLAAAVLFQPALMGKPRSADDV